MQENNFEKQVRQKLDELQLTPSEPVWKKIEATIKKKRERRLLFWLLPFLLLGGGFYWWHEASWPQQDAAQQGARKTNTPSSQTFSKPHTTQAAPPTNTTAKPTIYEVKHKTKKNEKQENKSVVKNITDDKMAAQKHVRVAYRVTRNQPEEKKQTAPQNFSETDSPVAKAVPHSVTARSVKTQIATQQANAELKSNTIQNHDTAQQIISKKADSAAKVFQSPIKKTTAKKHLQWSIVSRIGVSNTVKGFTSNFGQKTYETSNPAALYSTRPAMSDYALSTDSVIYRRPSAPTKGLQFSIGAVIKKPAGKNNFINAGLQYGFYSTRLTVGAELPASALVQNSNFSALKARKAFRNNGTLNTQFTNAFQYIELPVSFEYRLLKKVPLQVQQGLVFGQLIASKMLQYDYISNVYYQGSAGLRQTSLSVFASASYPVWKAKSFSLEAGPSLQYSLKPLFKTASANHLLSGGMAINMSF